VSEVAAITGRRSTVAALCKRQAYLTSSSQKIKKGVRMNIFLD